MTDPTPTPPAPAGLKAALKTSLTALWTKSKGYLFAFAAGAATGVAAVHYV